MSAELAWAEIDLEAIAHNIGELKRNSVAGAIFMAVVKADGYGHGAVEVAKTAVARGAGFLGVARIAEGMQLRKAGLDAPILVFGYTPPELAPELIRYDLTQSVYRVETAKHLSEYALTAGTPIKVHLKIDTGMGRLGLVSFLSGYNGIDAVEAIDTIRRCKGLKAEGIFTHFATADSADKTYSRLQFERFIDLLERLRRKGIEFRFRHCANSAGIIDLPETHLDMVRGGIAMYGLYPSDEVDHHRISLKAAMSLKARIIHLKRVPAGFMVSYGMTHATEKPTTIATVSIGYADGLSRQLSSKGHMLVRGMRAPIVGRVCMDLTMLDVGHIPEASPEDEVVIFGRQGEAMIHVDEIASRLNTINYEVVASVSRRVSRIYHS